VGTFLPSFFIVKMADALVVLAVNNGWPMLDIVSELFVFCALEPRFN
jgi:hypothetical protein